MALIWQNSRWRQQIELRKNELSALKKRAEASGFPEWRAVFEAIGIICIALMPVLKDWEWGLLIPVLLALRLSARESPVNPLAFESLIFGLVLFISAIFSSGFKSGGVELAGYGVWLMIFWLAGKFSPEYSRKIIIFLVFSSMIWIVLGLMQKWAGVPTPPGWLTEEQSRVITVRIYSIFDNPNIYGLYLLSNLVLGSFLLENSTGYRKHLLAIIWVLTVVSLYLTYSRTAWFLGIAFLTADYWRKLGRRRWLIGGAFLTLLLASEGFKVRSSALLHLTDSSFWHRLRIWEGVIRVIRDFWLWGAGPGSFFQVYPGYQMGTTPANHAHQLYLQLWLEHGIFSLGAFIFWVKNFFLKTGRVRGLRRKCALIVIIFLGYGLVESWFQSQLIAGYFWLFSGLTISLMSMPEEHQA